MLNKCKSVSLSVKIVVAKLAASHIVSRAEMIPSAVLDTPNKVKTPILLHVTYSHNQ